MEKNEDTSLYKEDETNKPKIKKSLKQQIASAQLRLNRLQHKSKQEGKQMETRQKIILGAEVAKAVDSNVFDVDKELILGFLLDITRLSDEEKIKYKKRGRAFLLEMKGRQV
ncbi:conjugal transfer protein TraD [Klebsiella electrica]|uniref:Conjugal transfer protein TraD n=1 Tax=Klebsiella electrica TaxID=1259973 RepID=A0AAJ5QRH6_9ENTR|nr:conjugal transfer protein TraD [Klebsiella electrica]WBW59694.1 conjugal transfer protein TraD [Klebsiella electrica]